MGGSVRSDASLKWVPDMKQVLVVGRLIFEPETRVTWLMHVADMVAASRQEPGVVRYEVLADPENSTDVILLEHYVDGDALAAHRTSAHLARFRSQTKGVGPCDRAIDLLAVGTMEPSSR